MDEKTEQLRDIFVDVAGSETVTERQDEGRGSLTVDEEAIERRLEETVDRMREELDFETALASAAYCRIVRGFYDGETDATIAQAAGVDSETVARARFDLHLLREAETEFPFDPGELRRRLEAGEDLDAAAAALDADVDTVRRCRRVLDVVDGIRRVNDRFREEFAELLTDADLRDHTDAVGEDGLEDATADAEVDVSF